MLKEEIKVVQQPEIVSRKQRLPGEIFGQPSMMDMERNTGLPCMRGFSVHHLPSKFTATKKEQIICTPSCSCSVF